VAAARALVAKAPAADPRRTLAEQLLALAAAPPKAPLATPDAVTTAGATAAATTAADAKATEAKAVDPLPTDYEGLMRRGDQAARADRSQTAFEAFKKAAALRGDIAEPWLKLGWAALDANRHADAERAFRKALAVDASLAEAQFGLGESLRFAGRKDEALEAYRAYVAMDPGGRDAAIAQRAIEELQ
jgi:tetratricopeptide (TPR) repeat protein